MHPLITALGITKLPVGLSENELVEKILNDSFLNRRAQYHMVSQFAETAIKQMHSIEISGFVKRLGCGPALKLKVDWNVGQGATSGQFFIRARTFSQEIIFTGPPENARLLKFCGEFCPSHICEEYERAYKPVGFSQDADQHGHFPKIF